MLRRRIIGVAGLAALLLCAAASAWAGGPPRAGDGEDDTPPIGRTWVHDCPAGPSFTVEVWMDRVRLFAPGGPVALPRAISASGARFAEGPWAYWSKGRDARIETPDGEWHDCAGREIADPWQAARLRGVTFRAIGQEPGWVVEIGPDRMVALLDYATRSRVAPAPDPASEGEATVWRVRAQETEIRVVSRPVPCRDAMSGEAFAQSVTLREGGTVWRGCGRFLD